MLPPVCLGLENAEMLGKQQQGISLLNSCFMLLTAKQINIATNIEILSLTFYILIHG